MSMTATIVATAATAAMNSNQCQQQNMYIKLREYATHVIVLNIKLEHRCYHHNREPISHSVCCCV